MILLTLTIFPIYDKQLFHVLSISHSIIQIKKEGYGAVHRKIRKFIILLIRLPLDIVGYLLAIPLVVLARMLRPFVLVRFGFFFAGRIGHFSFDVEYYLTEKHLGLHPRNVIDLFY